MSEGVITTIVADGKAKITQPTDGNSGLVGEMAKVELTLHNQEVVANKLTEVQTTLTSIAGDIGVIQGEGERLGGALEKARAELDKAPDSQKPALEKEVQDLRDEVDANAREEKRREQDKTDAQVEKDRLERKKTDEEGREREAREAAEKAVEHLDSN